MNGRLVINTGGESSTDASIKELFLTQGLRVTFVQQSGLSLFFEKDGIKHQNRPHLTSGDISDISKVSKSLDEAEEKMEKYQFQLTMM